MDVALNLALAGAVVTFVLIAVVAIALTVWALEALIRAVQGLPWPVSNLASLLSSLEQNYLNLARLVVNAAYDLLVHAAQISYLSFQALHAFFNTAISFTVRFLLDGHNTLVSIVSLAIMPPVEKELPALVQQLERAAEDLAKEPELRSSGPLRALLVLVQAIMRAIAGLGGFLRLVALPVTLIVLVFWGLLETLGRITRLETLVNGLIGFVHNLDLFRQADEAAFAQLVVVVNGLLLQGRQLQVDLEKERAARVALATQTQQAIAGATAAATAQNAATRSQLTPLLILGVLASLGASGLDVLRKTAQCDPCGRLDTGDWSDLPDRVEALENFGP